MTGNTTDGNRSQWKLCKNRENAINYNALMLSNAINTIALLFLTIIAHHATRTRTRKYILLYSTQIHSRATTEQLLIIAIIMIMHRHHRIGCMRRTWTFKIEFIKKCVLERERRKKENDAANMNLYIYIYIEISSLSLTNLLFASGNIVSSFSSADTHFTMPCTSNG